MLTNFDSKQLEKLCLAMADTSHRDTVSTKFSSERNEGHGGEKKGTEDDKKSSWSCLACEVTVQVVAIGCAWMLLLVPIILYHLPGEVFRRHTGELVRGMHIVQTRLIADASHVKRYTTKWSHAI